MEDIIEWKLLRQENIKTLLEIEHHPDNKKYMLTWSEEQYKNAVKSTDSRIFLLMQNSMAIGYTVMCGFDNAFNSIELKRLSVKIREQGIGKKALKSLMHYVFETCGKRKIWLQHFAFNTRAANLYKSVGFVIEGIRREEVLREDGLHDLYLLGILSKEYKEVSKNEAFNQYRVE